MPFNTPNIAPPTLTEPWVNREGVPTSNITDWLLTVLLPAIGVAPSVFSSSTPPYSEAGLNASVAATDLPVGTLADARYRVSVYLRITTPAGVSSSVTPFVDYTDGGVACTQTGPAMTSNAINQPLSHTFVLDVASPGPIRFGTTYVSNPAGAAVYKAIAMVERVN